jgi:Asp-tRNA(Asn)/Glu-tRNA(Gln) amidotransferase A subunit family amidase
VRIPAAANGCVSLKPTGGRIPNDGHIPMPAPDIHDWNTAGPMARRIEDLTLALNVLSNTPVRDVDAIEIKGRRAYTFATFYTRGIVRETLGMAAGALQAQGMQTEGMGSHIIDRATLAYFAIFERTNGKLLRQALGGGAYNLGDELKAHLQGKGRITPQVMYFTHAMQALGWLARLLGFGKIDKLENLRQQFNEALGDGVLLAPILVTPPKKHKWLWNLHMQIPTTLMFNALGVPSVAIPIRWQDNGLPLAIQVIAAQGNDEIALAVAGELERIFGGWRPART